MVEGNWERVRQVFDDALRHKPEERRHYIKEACGEDQDLLAEVESLISSLDNSDDFMETPAVAAVADIIESERNRLETGTRFGHYEIICEVGTGGMGQVYLAQDKKLDRQVALKILTEEFDRHESNAQRFIQEAKAASALNHPNILVIHEIGKSKDTHYIVSEFVRGKTLRETLKVHTLNLAEVLDTSIQIAHALTAAHEARLVHRDIKPENIMIRPDGYVKVLDFGLAKLVEKKRQSYLDLEESSVKENQTAKGVIFGTVNYMSPEQAKGESVDERTDIFSLGVVIYEMVSGRTPFARDSMSETFTNLINNEPQPLSQVPDELTYIVSKMLRKNKDKRYQTMKDVLTDLKDLRAQLTLAEKPEKAEQKTKIQLLAQALLGALILSGLTVGVLYFWMAGRVKAPKNDPTVRSIAVLPLTNLSGEPTQEYLADGMTDALINELAKITELRIISRTSMMQYKGVHKTTPEIARELKVDAVVEGSVVRYRDRVRITAQLVHAENDVQLWAESYERELRDVLAVQREIARGIASGIRIKLTPEELKRLAGTHPVNPAAHEAYLKGLYYMNQGINASQLKDFERLHKKSFEYFEQAIKLDPDYALVYSGLARAYHWLASGGLPEFYPKAKEASLKAIELDDTLADAHGALAYTIWQHEWDFVGAEREFKKALNLDPNSTYQHGYALLLSSLGRHDEAIRTIKLAEGLDPLTMPLKFNVGWIYLNARQYNAAAAQFRSILDLDPNRLDAHWGLGMAYVLKGMFDEGIAEFRKGMNSSNEQNVKADIAWAYAMAGRRSQAIRMLDDLKDPSKQKSVSPAQLAMIYGALGEKDLGMAQLDKAFVKDRPTLLWAKVDPQFDDLRSDPRFTDVMRRVGLPL